MTHKEVFEVVCDNGARFWVGEKIPETAYMPKQGYVAAVVNNSLPDGVVVLIKDHIIIKILDARGGDSGKVELDGSRTFDAIGLNEYQLEQNHSLVVGAPGTTVH